jgi:hypothetical protein
VTRVELATALVAATALGGVAHAGGLERPNGISARAVGQGGAFCAVADDGTAWHWNPGAPALNSPTATIGAELVIAPRSYVPIDAAGTRGDAQSPDTPIVPVPSLGVSVRASDRVTVGGGVWNPFGGQLTYAKTGMAAIDATQDLVIEVVGGVAYKVTPRLAVGATVRLGVGLFSVETTDRPVTSDISGFGLGPGVGFGVAWRPIPRLAFGATWRSAMTVDVSGSGKLAIGTGLDLDMSHKQEWPQSVELGAAVAATSTVRVSAQVDWTGWTSFEQLAGALPGAARRRSGVRARLGQQPQLPPRRSVAGDADGGGARRRVRRRQRGARSHDRAAVPRLDQDRRLDRRRRALRRVARRRRVRSGRRAAAHRTRQQRRGRCVQRARKHCTRRARRQRLHVRARARPTHVISSHAKLTDVIAAAIAAHRASPH